MKCVCISCFDYYSTRMKRINDFFEDQGYQVYYLYAGFDHFAKKSSQSKHKHGIKVHIPKYKKNLSIQRLVSHYTFARKVVKFLHKSDPDLIYCMFPPNSLVKQLVKYKNQRQVKLIFDCYDMWPESFPYAEWNGILRIPFLAWRNLRKKYISRSDLIITVSNEGKKALQAEAAQVPIEILKPFIEYDELPDFNADISNSITFCYLGMINHITDIDLGVSLLSKINEKKRVILHIIGEGQNLNDFIDRLESNGVKVICHGVEFDMKKKNKIFSLCNFGLNIPREEIGSTMSLKAVEYLRAGLPFLSSASGDIQEIVKNEKTGVDITQKNISDIADKILNLTSVEILKLHENCVSFYYNHFETENLNKLMRHIV